MVWYGMVWYGMIWYGMVWHGMVSIRTSQHVYKSLRNRYIGHSEKRKQKTENPHRKNKQKQKKQDFTRWAQTLAQTIHFSYWRVWYGMVRYGKIWYAR